MLNRVSKANYKQNVFLSWQEYFETNKHKQKLSSSQGMKSFLYLHFNFVCYQKIKIPNWH